MCFNLLFKDTLFKNKIKLILKYNYKNLFYKLNITTKHNYLLNKIDYLLYFNIKNKNKKIINIYFINRMVKYYSLGLLLTNNQLKKNLRRSVLNLKLLINLFVKNLNFNTNLGLFFNSYCLKKYLNYYFSLFQNFNFNIKFFSVSNFLTSNLKIKRSIKRRISKRVI